MFSFISIMEEKKTEREKKERMVYVVIKKKLQNISKLNFSHQMHKIHI